MSEGDVERVTHCSGDGAPLEAPAYAVSIGGASFGLRACPVCRRRVLDPRPTEPALARWYDAAYFGAGESKFIAPVESFVAWFRDRRARMAARLLSGVGRRPGLAPRVLDVGCGNGRFLGALAARGFECDGTERSAETAGRAAGVPGIRVHAGPVEAGTYPAGAFDLITIWHVLEHLDRPDEMLGCCNRWLRDGGWLLLAVPNVDSWQARLFRGDWFHLDPPRHLVHFGPASLGAALRSAGFRVDRIRHLSWEQNLYGVLQSALNALGFARDDLYECLKGNRRFGGLARDYAQAFLAALLFLPAVAFTGIEAAFRAGGTIECLAVKEPRSL